MQNQERKAAEIGLPSNQVLQKLLLRLKNIAVEASDQEAPALPKAPSKRDLKAFRKAAEGAVDRVRPKEPPQALRTLNLRTDRVLWVSRPDGLISVV